MNIFNYLSFYINLLNSVYLGFAAIGLPYFFGITFFDLFKIDKKKYGYLETFVGLAIIILVCQNLVYLDVPISHSAPILFGSFVVVWLYLFFMKRIRIKIDVFSTLVICALGVVWFINGIGYLRETSRWYKGSGWADQFNYTVTAEFLKDHNYSMSYSDVKIPYLYEALAKKSDRIGQSVYHAFVSSTVGLSSDRTYGAVSLLAPILVFLAFLFIFSTFGFNKYFGLVFSLMAGVLPSVSVIHLENFFSQALGTPILFVVITTMLFWNNDKFNIKEIFVDSLIVALLVSVYTEYLPFVMVIGIVIILFSFIEKKGYRSFIYLFSLSTLSVLLNVFYWATTINILKRTNLAGILAHVYPFNHTWYGYQRLFFGDLVIIDNLYLISFLVLLSVASVLGFITYFLKRKKWQILILACFPLVSLALDLFTKIYSYQTYKLLLSFTPFYIIGLTFVFETIYTLLRRNYSRFVCLGVVMLIVIVPSYATLKLSNMNYLGGGRSIKPIVNSIEHRDIYNMLENSKGKNIFLAANHPYEFGWMTYYGRNNNLFFINKILCDMDISGLAGSSKFTTTQTFPDDIEIVSGVLSFPKIDSTLSVIGYIDGSIEGLKDNTWSWIGKEIKMSIFSKKNVKVKISFQAYAGPANQSRDRVLKIKNTTTNKEYFFSFKDFLIEDGLNVDLVNGNNVFVFEVVKPTLVEYIPQNDRRVFMVALHNLRISSVNKKMEKEKSRQ